MSHIYRLINDSYTDKRRTGVVKNQVGGCRLGTLFPLKQFPLVDPCVRQEL
jgi:hypothetical protein